MKNQFSTYIVLDGGDGIILFYTSMLPVATFLQRNVLDTRLHSFTIQTWNNEYLPTINSSPGFYRFKIDEKITLEKRENVSQEVINKTQRCKMLAEGYSWLLWFANQITEQYSTTETLSYDDLILYNTNKEEFIKMFAEVKNIPIEQSQKQFEFDHQTLLSVILRRKQILWMFSETLKECTTNEELKVWKDKVFNSIVRVGAL
jgi:hypothetical protein